MEYNRGRDKREEAFKKLTVFLKNPGRFCLIVLGARGTGKRFAIEQVFKEIKDTNDEKLCLKELKFTSAKNIPSAEKEMDVFLKQHEHMILVIEDIEDINYEQEKLLFDALSTSDGSFGINEKVNLRIVFTSSKESDLLRDDVSFLTGFFWDRISQLIVELPSYKQEPENVIKDFIATWKKMKFDEIEEYKALSAVPKYCKFDKYLEDFADKFDGGFRDLDKLACMYFNYRIYHYGEVKKINENIEDKVVSSIKDDFFPKSQMKSITENNVSTFRFEKGLDHNELLAKYKIQLRRWAVKEYGSVKKAEEKLGFKPGTMKNYVKGKVTKTQKNSEKK